MFPPGFKWLPWLTVCYVALTGTCAGAVDTSASDVTNNDIPPTLTTASEVAHLKRNEAQRGYPVKIRGVVTCVVPEHNAFVLQDTTRGVFVVDETAPTKVGELWEVEGITARGSFAPIVKARQKTFLGLGELPPPIKPTWDQLMNGSLDDQLVELEGVVDSAHYDTTDWSYVILRTQGGSLRADLPYSGVASNDLMRCEKNLVRIRGCFFAKTDDRATWQVKAGQVRIYNAALAVDETEDPFSVPAKTAAELMLFDPKASAFRRVKISGQIIHVRGGEHFMMDGTNGVRFIAEPVSGLKPGDIVEVAGFPELGGASPLLTEAVARKNGHAPLPEAKRLPPDDLIQPMLDSTLVRVEGLLASVKQTPTNLVMEMQVGSWRLLARLDGDESALQPLRIGSRLDLTGVYSAQGGYKTLSEDVAAVDLLLNSPADIAVLSTPPWWTLRRMLILVGALACVLVGAMLWITQLRRQVAEQTAKLEAQILERERADRQRAVEQERTRIAQDLHDELGSGLTEISMLAARSKSAAPAPGNRSVHLDQMNDRAREMVVALDEIVWAMNPRHDSLESLVSYFSLYADRFLGLAGISWRLENRAELPEHTLDSQARHQLFLAFKEALTNVVRHAQATEVRVNIQVLNGELWLAVSDNGHGAARDEKLSDVNGLANMKSRIEKLGGRFEMKSETGRGTTVRFCVPPN